MITDVNMPRIDGYQLARRLRELDPQVPIIGVTANALREEGEQCLEAGMNVWLVKPLSLTTLRQTLSAYCRNLHGGSYPHWRFLLRSCRRMILTAGLRFRR